MAVNNSRPSTMSSIDIYLKQINQYPLIGRDEEVELAKAAQAGDASALDALVRANLRFVVSVAKRYIGHGVPLEDLVNEGNMGLVKAAHKFDPDRGFKFISYAVWWIKQAILQSLAKHSRIVHLPLNRAGTLAKINKVSRALDQELGRQPTQKEIADRTGLGIDEVEKSLSYNATYLSLDDPMPGNADNHTFLEYVEDENSITPDKHLYEETLVVDVEKALRSLPERERTILKLYFGLDGEEPHTLEQIGKILNYTRERIRQLKEQSIDRLRHKTRSELLSGYLEN